MDDIQEIKEGRPEKLPNNSAVKTQSDLANELGVSVDTIQADLLDDVDRENLEKELDELEHDDLAEDGFMDGITREYTGVILDDTYD